MAVSYLYVQKHFNNESREKVCTPHMKTILDHFRVKYLCVVAMLSGWMFSQ
jgi:hypothetical protein